MMYYTKRFFGEGVTMRVKLRVGGFAICEANTVTFDESFLSLWDHGTLVAQYRLVDVSGLEVVGGQEADPGVAQGKAYSVEVVRTQYPNAYQRWTPEEDAELMSAHADGATTKKLASTFGRQEGAVRSRVNKLLFEGHGGATEAGSSRSGPRFPASD
ncbi:MULTISPECIES: hypothetical protein [Plantibacter]|uniref:hypothetical protein n=1 Tax=Plantibacter TaxID=190323 RepID=UPI0010C17E70|nr:MULTISPECIES: hypothetical protein [Plantibacter]MBD8104385.1 hypothetical protein [Plantibacter sp. CFBP 8775]